VILLVEELFLKKKSDRKRKSKQLFRNAAVSAETSQPDNRRLWAQAEINWLSALTANAFGNAVQKQPRRSSESQIVIVLNALEGMEA
jgi:hypothetical protein